MIRLLLGGSSHSFKTITSEDAFDLQKRFFYDAATGMPYGGKGNRAQRLSSVIDMVQGEVIADNTSLIGATRFDKKFTTSLLAQSNSELLQEVGRMQQMYIRGIESRTGKNIQDLLQQLKETSPGQGLVSRLRGTLMDKDLTEQELVELTGLAGTMDFEQITKLKPNEISDRLTPLVSMSAQEFAEHIKTMPGLRTKRIHIERCLKTIRVIGRSIFDSIQHIF